MRTPIKVAVLILTAIALSACAGTPSRVNRHALAAPRPANPVGDAPHFVVLASPKSCAIYARERSGIDIHADAVDWWSKAGGRYAREHRPLAGSVIVLTGYAGPKHGHVAVVTKVVSSREIRVDHTNWLNDGNLYLNSPVIDVSPDNDWSAVKVWNNAAGHMGASTYPVQGFIGPNGPS